MPDIKIRIQKGEETVGDGVELQESQNKGLNASDKANIVSLSFVAQQSVSLLKMGMSKAISTIGMNTGDYILQKNVENVMNIGEWAISTGVAFASNVYVGIAKLAMDALNSVSNVAIDIISNDKNNKLIEIIQTRTVNSAKNGSRTGN